MTLYQPSQHSLPANMPAGIDFASPPAAAHSDTSLAHSLAASAMDELASGMVIIDQFARVLHRNPAADAVLARGDCVALDSGHITVTHMPDVRKFSQALTQAAAGKRSMIALGNQGQTTVAIVPLRTTTDAHSNPNALGSPTSTQHFALVFSRTAMCEALMLNAFSRAYQLTPTEERVLGLMSASLTAPEMAKKLHIGSATIRTHVRNICAKTNCHGIREVVTRLAVLPTLQAQFS